jgi:hypothetical protein
MVIINMRNNTKKLLIDLMMIDANLCKEDYDLILATAIGRGFDIHNSDLERIETT